jgi:hypothetical protein
MKKDILAVRLFLLLICLQGCVVVVDEEQTHPRQSGKHPPSDGTIAEIDAVGKLNLESHKRQGYEKIAVRDNLSPEVQIHLVKAVFNNLALESSKENILLTLINNPSFCPAGERAILKRLDKLMLESNKRDILTAISECKNSG